ncbi:hypothetical protein BC833DRAFT_625023 [Globomyces pollinis-pini]|nr:hypothetical protein BC833DRAFT_625023 [Globomyces pollinis-pini]
MKPIISYHEDGQIWPTIQDHFASRLPLKNLDVVNPTRGTESKHCLPTMHLELLKYSPDLFPTFTPGAIITNCVFGHIFFCSTDDLDTYKNNSKKLIQEWLNIVANKKNQDWIIVHISNDLNIKSRLFGSNTTVTEKLKLDFNLKKEKFFQIKLSDKLNIDIWNDLMIRLRDILINGFTEQLIQYEEDSRKLEHQRLIPGWNYCQYFIQKEALSGTFEMMGLYKEALIEYDELEALFYQTLSEQGAPWFKKFGGTEIGDDHLDVFTINQKRFKELIIQNSITIFDFRMYLFARQTTILNLLSHPIEICHRTKVFVASFSKTLQEYKESLSKFFTESWTYSIVLNVIKHCDELFAISNYPPAAVLEYEGLKGELFQHARHQLDKLGVSSNLMPTSLHCDAEDCIPVDDLLDADMTSHEKLEIKTTNETLQNILKSKVSFDHIYEDLTNKCFRSFEICKRPATVAFLKADLAFLYFARQNYQKASDIFKQICFQYSRSGWNQIDSMLIERYAICQRQLHIDENLLESYLHLIIHPSDLTLESPLFYMDQLVLVAYRYFEPFVQFNSSLLSVRNVSVKDELAYGVDLIAQVDVISLFPKEIKFDKVALTFTAGDGLNMHLSATELLITPGNNQSIVLKGKKVAIHGVYIPTSISFTCGKLELKYDIQQQIQKSLKIYVEESFDSLSVTCYKSPMVGQKLVCFEVQSKASAIQRGSIDITPLTAISFTYQDSISGRLFTNEEWSDLNLTVKDSKILIPPLTSYSILTFSLPYQSTDPDNIKVILTDNLSESQKVVYPIMIQLQLSDPFSIVDHVSHSSDFTYLRYHLVSQVTYPVRLTSFKLKPVTVIPLLPESNLLLFSDQESIVVGKIPADQFQDSLDVSIEIEYQPLHIEIEEYLLKRLIAILKEFNVLQAYGHTKRMLLKLARNVDFSDLCYYGTIQIPAIDSVILSESFFQISSEQKSLLLDAIAQFNNELMCITEDMIASQPLSSLPMRKVIHQKSYQPCRVLLRAEWVIDKVERPHVGDLLTTTLSIKVQNWLANEQNLIVLFEISQNRSKYILGGPTRKKFVMTKTQATDFRIHITPLCPGPFTLPNIRFRVLDDSIEGVFFEGPIVQSGLVILPKEESCKRYFKEPNR